MSAAVHTVFPQYENEFFQVSFFFNDFPSRSKYPVYTNVMSTDVSRSAPRRPIFSIPPHRSASIPDAGYTACTTRHRRQKSQVNSTSSAIMEGLLRIKSERGDRNVPSVELRNASRGEKRAASLEISTLREMKRLKSRRTW